MALVINVYGPEGNAWVIAGYVRRILKAADRMDEWDDVEARLFAGDYFNLLQVAEEVTNGSLQFEGVEHMIVGERFED